MARYEQALALRPDFADAHNNLGNVLKEQGKFDEAAGQLTSKRWPCGPTTPKRIIHRADLKTFRAGDPDLAALEALAADPDRLPPGKMVYIHFALGKALEDVGDYHGRLRALAPGQCSETPRSPLRRSGLSANFPGHRRAVRRQPARPLCARSGDPSPVPIFIVGMPRSGSTLVEQILASHPQVHAAGELTNLNRVVQAVADSAAAGRFLIRRTHWALDADGLRRLGQAYLASLPPLPDGKTRITDKVPSNFFHVGLIRLILPNARIIHTLRDPVDTCVSCFSKTVCARSGVQL